MSVCPSAQAGTVQQRLNTGSREQRLTIAHGLYFSVVKDIGEIPTGSPQRGHQIEVGVGYNRRLSTNISLYLRNGAR